MNIAQLYREDICRYELLTARQEQELGRIKDLPKAIEAPGGYLHQVRTLGIMAMGPEPEYGYDDLVQIYADADAAKDTMFKANLRLVVAIADRYPLPTGMTILDHIQEGNIGLIKAVEQFDYRRGFRFSSLADKKIRREIGRALNTKSTTIKLPREVAEAVRAAKLHAAATEGTEIPLDMQELIARVNTLSLDKELSHESNGFTLKSTLPSATTSPEDAAEVRNIQQQMIDLLWYLDATTRSVVALKCGYFGDDELPYSEIARRTGLSNKKVARLYKEGIAHLQKLVERHNLGYLAASA